jgi:hypothetical protein
MCVLIRIYTMNQSARLKLRQANLHRQIIGCLDLLLGSLHKTPSQAGYHLTTKVQGKSVTQYVRKALVPQVRARTHHHRRLRQLLPRLSAVNWQLLHAPSRPR